MKSVILVVALFVVAISNQTFAQDSTKIQTSAILTTYYQLKDNLVKSNPVATAASADAFIKAINESGKETVSETAKQSLLADANAIAQSKDISVQRDKFATLSNNILELAKSVKLSPDPVYQQYCPMKKVSWLSNSKAIKNPYYGSAMLTCGSVKATL